MITPERLLGPSEGQHQAALFCWAQQAATVYPDLEWLYAIPNGDSRGGDARSAGIVGNRLKAQGLKPGYPDIGLDVAKRGYHGLRIELKYGKGVAGDLQKGWLTRLQLQGYCAHVVWGYENARNFLIWYLT